MKHSFFLALLLAALLALGACTLPSPGTPGATGEITALDGVYITEPDFVDYPVTRVYYETLSAPGQQAYRLIYNAVFAQPAEIAIPPITLEELKVVVKALMDDNPQILGLDNRFSYRKSGGTGYFLPNYVFAQDECARRTREAVDRAKQIADEARSLSGTWERELYVHDALADAVAYEDGDFAAEIYGALVGGKAVCEGYAYSMKLVLDMLGIPACVVRGTGISPEGVPEGHMWNLVDPGGGWRHLDLTWDDPVSERENNLSHAYFNVGDGLIAVNHRDFVLPPAVTVTENDADDYYVRGDLVCTAHNCEDVIARAFSTGADSAEFRFTDEESLDTAQKVLFDSHGIYRLLPDPDAAVSYAVDRETRVMHIYVG